MQAVARRVGHRLVCESPYRVAQMTGKISAAVYGDHAEDIAEDAFNEFIVLNLKQEEVDGAPYKEEHAVKDIVQILNDVIVQCGRVPATRCVNCLPEKFRAGVVRWLLEAEKTLKKGQRKESQTLANQEREWFSSRPAAQRARRREGSSRG